MKLTKSIVDRAAYEGDSHVGSDGRRKWSRYVLWDDAVRGLGLRITPKGKKSFVLSYRTGRRKRLMTLGPYGVLTLREARGRATKELARVLDGEDPLNERETASAAPTVAEIGQRYLEQHARVKKKPSGAKTDEQMLRDYILPRIGTLRVADITSQDIGSIHHALHEKPYVANRVLFLLSTMLNLSEKWGLRPGGSNPCRHVKKFKEAPRERYLTTEELRRLSAALAEAEDEGRMCPYAIAAIRLLILTGCRLREILRLRWEHVDLERKVLRLPDSKTGAKPVYLSEPACDLLRSVPRTVGAPYVIEGRKPGSHRSDLKRPWKQICETAELEDLRIHDLRHSFAAVGAGLGLSLPMIGKLLGHSQTRTTSRYAHLASDPMHEAAERIGSALQIAVRVEGLGPDESIGDCL